MEFLDKIIALKRKNSGKNTMDLDDSILTIVKQTTKTAGLIMSIVILSLIGLVLAIKAYWMIPNLFFISAATLFFIVAQDRKSEFLNMNGLFLLLGNIIGIFGSATTEHITGWSFFFQGLIGIFGICLLVVGGKMEKLERKQKESMRYAG